MSLFKSASTVSLFTLASRITGLGRELLIASWFGASALTDAFNVAFRIPNLFRRLFAEGAFSQAFVPVLAATRETSGDAATRRLVGHVATLLFCALVLTCIIGVAGAPALVWALASGLSQSTTGHEAAVLMTRIMFPYIGFMSLVALAAGVLNTWGRFAVPAAAPVLLNVSMIGVAWWGRPWFESWGWPAIYTLAAGVMLGGVMQLTLTFVALHRLGIPSWPSLRPSGWRAAWQEAGCQRILALMAPALLGVGVAQLSLLINTQIASHLTPGSVSWLSYADRLMEFPTALLGVALGVALMPQLAAAKASGDTQRYSDMLDWGLRGVVLLATPSALGLLCLATPLVASLYHYGAFTAHDVNQTTLALMGYGVGLLGLVAIKVLALGFYASQDIKTPVRVAIGVLVLTQVINLVLVPWFAHAGLALSIGLGAWVNAIWLWWGLRRRGHYRPAPGWGRFLLQVGLACLVLAAWLLWVARSLDWVALQAQPWTRLGWLLLTLAVSALLYFGVLRVVGLKMRAWMQI
ncbi:MAG: murein biosynthesis integral membrane protein MurJ [Alphaproteobacteria bacterium]|nr:murein biosynthesis integral membrane protein MurJ [Alphaproteobacteria bacterium]